MPRVTQAPHIHALYAFLAKHNEAYAEIVYTDYGTRALLRGTTDQDDNPVLGVYLQAVPRSNPGEKPTTAALTFAKNVKTAWLTNMNEERRKELKANGRIVRVPLGKKKIGTVEVELAAT